MRSFKFFAAAAALLVSLTLTGTSLATDSTPRKVEGGAVPLAAVGSDPVNFNLKQLSGTQVELKPLLGNKAVMLVFWSLFCGPCQEELPAVNTIFKQYQDKGLEVFAVNLDGEKRAKAVEKYMEKQGFSFKVLWEVIEGVNYVTADAYGVAGTPTLVLIDKAGKVSFTHVGKTEIEDLEKAVKGALALQ